MRAFSRFTIAILGITLMLAVPNWGWAWTPSPSAVAIDSLTRLIVAENRINLPDPFKVQGGFLSRTDMRFIWRSRGCPGTKGRRDVSGISPRYT